MGRQRQGAYVGGSGRATSTSGSARAQRPVHAIHLGVETAGVAEIVAGAVPAPERGVYRPAVDALAALGEHLRLH